MNASQSRHYAIETENNYVLVLQGENILKMNYIVKPRIFKFLLTNHQFALASLFYMAWSLHITPL